MIDELQLTSVLDSLQAISYDRHNAMKSVKGLWESGIIDENKMKKKLDEEIEFVDEYYFPKEAKKMKLSGVKVTHADLVGYKYIDVGNHYRIEGKQTVLISKDIDIDEFNELKLDL